MEGRVLGFVMQGTIVERWVGTGWMFGDWGWKVCKSARRVRESMKKGDKRRNCVSRGMKEEWDR